MNLKKHIVDKIYKRFGYEINDSNKNITVYILRQGVYFGADIVSFCDTANVQAVKDEYSNIGYACRICEYENEQQVEEELFKGFFTVDSTLERLKAKYEHFVEKQTYNLGATYQYIPVPYKSTGIENESKSIIDNVLTVLKRQGPQLIILEAAAGYGKTCTAYEVLNMFLTQSKKQTPLITELSRNRQAKIFRYVLLDEIDKEFPSLGSELVQYEIQSGRIPLIIDGFDELLYKQIDSESKIEKFEEVESMLETIGQLLKTNAKIILTTRRTAIFSGKEFTEWMNSHLHSFSVTRFLLEEPDIEQWLGRDRYNLIEDSDVPINHLANPVLLSFLKNLSHQDFVESCKNSEIIIDKYFQSLLDREQERQAINLNPSKQIDIFKKVAGMMLDFDITSESREFIRDIILEQNKPLLEKTRNTYPVSSRPTVEQLAETLSNHALLDKVGGNEKSIGFINEFIFGILLGESICESRDESIQDNLLNEQMIGLAVTAFKVRSKENREKLWKKIFLISDLLDQFTKLNLDTNLLDKTYHDIKDTTLESLNISNCTLGGESKIERCVFVDSTFTKIHFVLDSFEEVGFLNCTFNSCTFISRDMSLIPTRLWERQSIEYNGSVLETIKMEVLDSSNTLDSNDNEISYELKVLENFWRPGKEHADTIKPFNSLLVGVKQSEYKSVTDAIENLKKRELIFFREKTVWLNTEKMNEIRNLLGR